MPLPEKIKEEAAATRDCRRHRRPYAKPPRIRPTRAVTKVLELTHDSSKNAEHAKPERSRLKPPERRSLEAPPARHQAEETLTCRRSTLRELRRRNYLKVNKRSRAEEPTHIATRHQIVENWHRSTKWKTRSGQFTNPKSRRLELSLTRCPRQGSRGRRPPQAVDPHEQATVAEGAPRNQRPPSISNRSGGAEIKRKEKTEIRGRESASDAGGPDAGAEYHRR
ncbi:unnamed protein product [Brassica rapa subsp. trilocularis]